MALSSLPSNINGTRLIARSGAPRFCVEDIPPSRHPVIVTPSDGAERVLTVFERAEQKPDHVTVIDATPSGIDDVQPRSWATVGSCSPGDLTGLSIELSKAFDAPVHPTYVFIQNLSVFLQYVPVNKLYRFLHLTFGYYDTRDIGIQVTIDPSAVTQSDLAALVPLYDSYDG